MAWTARSELPETWSLRTALAETWARRGSEGEVWKPPLPTGKSFLLDVDGAYVMDGLLFLVADNG